MQEIQFDYFRGMEADQYSFYKVPKALFTAECFRQLSCEAKVLYGLLLDRMGLSIKNRWFDVENRVYIIFTVEEIAALLNCGPQKAVKLLKELDSDKGIGLIEKKRLGLGKPNVIYVKNFMLREADSPELEMEKKRTDNSGNMLNGDNHNSEIMESAIQECAESQFKNDENHNSGMMKTTIQECAESQSKNGENHNSEMMKTTIQECPKPQSNKTDINKNEYSETEYSKTEVSDTGLNKTDYGLCVSIQSNPSGQSYPSAGQRAAPMDMAGEMDIYRSIIREKIGYGCFQVDRDYRTEDVDELVELMVDVMLMPDGSALRVAGVDRPAAVVKNRFMKIGHEHIQYALGCLQKNTTKVGNIKAYLLATLYNATLTMSNYYQAEVNHDMYGGGWSG